MLRFVILWQMKAPSPSSSYTLLLILATSLLVACGETVDPEASAATHPTIASYIGSAACWSCHIEEAGKWQDSHHDQAMREATSTNVVGDFSNTTVTTVNGSALFAEDEGVAGGLTIATSLGDDHETKFPVKYTFGIHPLQQYLLDTGDGKLQAFTVAWDARHEDQGGQRWFDLRPGEAITSTDTLHWSGRAYNWNSMCADCHSTAVKKNYAVATDSFATTFAEVNVGCEACHGPGSVHVTFANNGDTAPGGLTDIRPQGAQINVCAPCHSRRSQLADGFRPEDSYFDHYAPALLDEGLYYADGQIRDEVYVYGSFLQSKMHRRGVRCTDCHDPHSAQLHLTGNAVCTTCHQPNARADFPMAGGKDYESFEHHFHPERSSGAQCVNCHMPATVFMEIDPRRDHSFRIPRPDLTIQLEVPNACNQCHADRTAAWAAEQIQLRFGVERPDHFASLFDAASRGLSSAEPDLAKLVGDVTRPIMVRATAAARLGSYNRGYTLDALKIGLADPDPLIRYGSLRGLSGLTEDSRWRLGNGLLSDERKTIRQEAFRTLLGSASDPNRRTRLRPLLAEYLEVQTFNAERPEAHTSAATAHAVFGNLIDAEAAFEKALAIEPDWVPAMVNLADLYRANGQDMQGRELLERAITSSPENADVHYAFALWLIRNDESDRALAEFSKAHQFAPELPGYSYALALALNGSGRTEQALELLQDAHAQWPQNTDFLFALATMSRDLERFAEAREYIEKLLQIAPANANYRTLRGELTQQPGNIR